MEELIAAVGGRVVQIHSSKRIDRERLTRMWTREHRVTIPTFEAVMRANGAEGCVLSHKAVATQLQAPYLVLEDDALPTAAMRDIQHVVHVLQAVESNEFDIVYLGGLPAATRVLQTAVPGVLEGRCGATFAMVVFPRAAAFLQSMDFDGVPVDVQLVRAKHLRVAFVHPPLFVMAATHSDIGKNEFNKSRVFAEWFARMSPIWRWLVVWQKELLGLVLVLAFLWSRSRVQTK
jgi:hypothetical protein